MGFDTVINMAKPEIPGRFYLHTAGREVYGNEPLDIIDEAQCYILNAILGVAGDKKHRPNFFKSQFLIGLVWGEASDKEKILDLFGYQYPGVEEWPGNASPFNWVIVNGVVRNRPPTCEEGFTVLSNEGKLRKSKKSLGEYVSEPSPAFVLEHKKFTEIDSKWNWSSMPALFQ